MFQCLAQTCRPRRQPSPCFEDPCMPLSLASDGQQAFISFPYPLNNRWLDADYELGVSKGSGSGPSGETQSTVRPVTLSSSPLLFQCLEQSWIQMRINKYWLGEEANEWLLCWACSSCLTKISIHEPLLLQESQSSFPFMGRLSSPSTWPPGL